MIGSSAWEYPAASYARTRPGTPVLACLFAEMPGNSASHAFAGHLGIDDAWDFNQHRIDPARVRVDALRAFLCTLHDQEDYLPDIERFLRLREKQFQFFFRPNGRRRGDPHRGRPRRIATHRRPLKPKRSGRYRL